MASGTPSHCGPSQGMQAVPSIAAQACPRVMASYSGGVRRCDRGRSRSVRRPREDDLCSICQEKLDDGTDTWNCAVCGHARMRMACRVVARGRNVRGCPHCRCNRAEASQRLTGPFLVATAGGPEGLVCYVCRGDIWPGTQFRRCARSRERCAALWHESCHGARGPVCPACRFGLDAALQERCRRAGP